MSLFNLVAFAIIIAVACYVSRCGQRRNKQPLPREIQNELDPFHKSESHSS